MRFRASPPCVCEAAAKTAKNGQDGEFFEKISKIFRKFFFSYNVDKQCFLAALNGFAA